MEVVGLAVWMFGELGGGFKYFFIFTPIWGRFQF